MKWTPIVMCFALVAHPTAARAQQVKPVAEVKAGDVTVIELDRAPGKNQALMWTVESGPGEIVGDKTGARVSFRADRPGLVVVTCMVRDPNGQRPSTVRFQVMGPAIERTAATAAPSLPPPPKAPRPVQPQPAPAPTMLPLEQIEFMIPSGWMGDAMTENGEAARLDEGVTTGCRMRQPCYRIEYAKGGKLGWAAFAWQRVPDGAMNWGEFPGVDLSDRGFRSIRGWARADGASGANVQFKSGGNVAPTFAATNKASYSAAAPPLALTDTYKEFCVDLIGKNLSNVVSPLTVVVTRAGTKGAAVAISDITYSTAACGAQ